MFKATKYMIVMLNREPKPKTMQTETHSAGPVTRCWNMCCVLVQQDKTDKLSTAFNPTSFKVVSKNRHNLMVESPTGKQYSRNTSHVKQYVNDPMQTPARTRCLDNTCLATHRRASYRTAGQRRMPWSVGEHCSKIWDTMCRPRNPRGHGDCQGD